MNLSFAGIALLQVFCDSALIPCVYVSFMTFTLILNGSCIHKLAILFLIFLHLMAASALLFI